MSERAPERIEAGGKFEIAEHSVEAASPAELAQAKAEQQSNKVEAAAAIAEEASSINPVEAYQAAEAAKAEPASTLVSTETRKADKNRQIVRIQRQLKPTDRVLSKAIHQPVIRAVSEATASTLARPSGLLGGGLVALLGSASYLYYAKHVGLPYNYLIFTLLFVGGFGFGLLIELLVWTATASKRRAD